MYLNKSYVLYKIMETLYKLRAYDFSYGKNIYKQLCLPFSSKLLNNYIEKRINNIKINNKVIKKQHAPQKGSLPMKKTIFTSFSINS